MTIAIENDQQVMAIVICSVSIFIATLFVGLRIYAKLLTGGLDYSEYCIIAALVFNNGMHTCGILLVTHGGFGFHVVDIYTRFGPDTANFFFKGITAFPLLWNVTICLSKLSILLMYTALIPLPSMIRTAKIGGLLIILWNTANIIATFVICRPLAKNWDFTLPGKCGSQPNFYFSMGMINIISDIFLLVLPMPYIYRLNMPVRKKLIAASMLSIGIMTWAITIYRQTLLVGLDFMDMTYSGVLATVLSGLEPSVAIALACLPLLRPLLGRRTTPAPTTEYGYGSGAGGSSQMYSKKGGRNFTELDDDADHDTDASSEVQLRPIKPIRDVTITSNPPEGRSNNSLDTNEITVERKWEVTHAGA